MSLKKKYLEFVEKLHRKGVALSSYGCPQCGFKIETVTPPAGQTFDSICQCPECEYTHYKIVHSDGSVEARPLTDLDPVPEDELRYELGRQFRA
jgi:uncharacterized protein with PIN domain